MTPRRRLVAVILASLGCLASMRAAPADVADDAPVNPEAKALLHQVPLDDPGWPAEVLPAGAIVPATPPAPGQGPLFDEQGSPWDEQRTAPPAAFWYARSIAAAWLPRNGAAGFGSTDVSLATSFVPIYDQGLPALMITPGFGFHFWQPPAGVELPSRVFDSYIDVTWRTVVNDRLGFGFGVTPGVYGDYEQLNSRAFQVTGWGTVDLRLSETVTVVAGAAVVRQLDLAVLPVGGLIWSISETERLELLVPRSRYARRMSTLRGGGALWSYVACEFGGGTWAVGRQGQANAVVTVSDLRAILGAEWFSTGRMTGVAEVGYVFGRTISFDRQPQFSPSDTIVLDVGTTF